MGLFSFTQEIAIDLGTANTIIIVFHPFAFLPKRYLCTPAYSARSIHP